MVKRPCYPKSYDQALTLLTQHHAQEMLLHDDLTLCQKQESIVVMHLDHVLVIWHDDRSNMVVVASNHKYGATAKSVTYISWFIPNGYQAKCNGHGRMLLHSPTGKTTCGNKQRIQLPGGVLGYEDFL